MSISRGLALISFLGSTVVGLAGALPALGQTGVGRDGVAPDGVAPAQATTLLDLSGLAWLGATSSSPCMMPRRPTRPTVRASAA